MADEPDNDTPENADAQAAEAEAAGETPVEAAETSETTAAADAEEAPVAG